MALDSEHGHIRVSVALVLPQVQELVTVELAPGATIGQAIERSGLRAHYALDVAGMDIAVFGERRHLSARVHDGDRIELLAPLRVDPKEARRLRARAQKPTNGRRRTTKGAT